MQEEERVSSRALHLLSTVSHAYPFHPLRNPANLFPSLLVVAQVPIECLLAPGHRTRVDDGREGADRLEDLRVLQGDGERPVAAHGVACDRSLEHRDR